MTLPIARLGEPILRQESKKVSKEKFKDDKFQQFVDDLKETLANDNRGVGLAAPQVYKPLQVYSIQLFSNLHPDILKASHLFEEGEIEVLVNPKITVLNKKIVYDIEGCLSFYDLVGRVPRVKSVRVDYKDRYGTPQFIEANDWLARLIQHEYDHLQGILLLDRLESLDDLYYSDVYKKLYESDNS